MLKVDGTVVNIGHFPDGTLLIKHPANYSEKEKQMCHEIQWLFENNEEMVALMYLTRHLQSHGVDRIELLMPYIPNARQDRVKSSEDVFTLKYFAEFINALGFSKVTVLDPHSYVSEALINNIVVKSPIDYISVAIGGTRPNLLFFPDEGAMKRYSGTFSLPYAFGGACFLYRSGDPKPRMSQLAMTRVGVEADTTQDIYLCCHGGDPLRFVELAEALDSLDRKVVDAVFFDDIPLNRVAEESGGRYSVTPVETRDGYGVAVDKRRPDVLAAADAVIAEGGAE